MRRIIAAASFVAAVSLGSALAARAQQLPYKVALPALLANGSPLRITAEPSATQTPDLVATSIAATFAARTALAPTPDVVGTAIAGTLTASAPTPTPEPTYTPTATATSTRRPILPTDTRTPTPTQDPGQETCTNVVQDGGFEANTDGPWRRAGDEGIVRFTKGSSGVTPHGGEWMGEMHPFEDETSVMVSNKFTGNPANLTKATLWFWWYAITLDHEATSDGYGYGLLDPNDTGDDSLFIKFFWNQNAVSHWTNSQLDVTSYMRTNRRDMHAVFSVSNDALDNSWWFIDDVSLTVCTRSGFVAPAAGPLPPNAQPWAARIKAATLGK